jgi:LysM repeat protein
MVGNLRLIFVKRLILIVSLTFFGSNPVSGDITIRVANLKQDMELVSRELAGLRTEVELLRRENAQLRVQVEQSNRKLSSNSGASSEVLQRMSNRLQSLESRLNQSEQSQIALNKNVELKMRDLIIQMNKGFDSVQSTPQLPAPAQTFTKDYPQKGFVHKVEKGETVSSIAKKYSSKTSWIINANQIADPKKVFVGKELFVPQN